MDGDAGPPQHEGGQNSLPLRVPSLERVHTPEEISSAPVRQTLGPTPGVRPNGGEHPSPAPGASPGRKPERTKEAGINHGEKDHKGADVQRGQKGVFDGAGKGCCEALGVELGPGLPLLPPGGWAGLVKRKRMPMQMEAAAWAR